MNEVILHKLLSGQAGAAEQERLENWISEDPAHGACFEKMKLIWTLAADGASQQIEPDTDAEWMRFQRQIAAIPYGVDLHKEVAKLLPLHPKAGVFAKNFAKRAKAALFVS